MEWINEKSQTMPLDNCSFNFCWTNDMPGVCGAQFCATRYCIIRF